MRRVDQQLGVQVPPPPPLSSSLRKFSARLEGWYRDFTSRLTDGHAVGGRRYHEWADATGAQAPAWSAKAMKPFLIFISRRPGRTQSSINVGTFYNDVISILSLYNRARRLCGAAVLSADTEEAVWAIVRDIGKKLPTDRQPRAHVSRASVLSMIESVPMACAGTRHMMGYLVYISVASCTGFRYSTICRADDKTKWDLLADHRRGLRWRCTVFWLLPSSGEATMNGVIAYVTPEWVKGGRHLLKTYFPLTTAPVLGASANLMLLLTAFLDAGSTYDDLVAVMSPSYLVHGQPRRLVLPAAIDDLFLVQDRNHRSPSTSTVNSTLKAISRECGFELDVTTHAFRHLVRDEVLRKHGSDAAERVLLHNRKSSTRKYVSKIIPSFVTEALFDDENGDSLSRLVRTNATISEEDAPRPRDVVKKKLNELRQDPELLHLHAQQQTIKESLVYAHGVIERMPADERDNYQALARRYRDRLNRLCEEAFQEERRLRRFFDARRRTAEQAPSVPQEPSASAMIDTDLDLAAHALELVSAEQEEEEGEEHGIAVPRSDLDVASAQPVELFLRGSLLSQFPHTLDSLRPETASPYLDWVGRAVQQLPSYSVTNPVARLPLTPYSTDPTPGRKIYEITSARDAEAAISAAR